MADKWGFSTDGTKYTITLKKGLTWSDGTPLTSKDVVDTYKIVRLEGGNNEFGLGVGKVSAVDDLTIDFTLTKPPSPLLERGMLKEIVVASSVYGTYADTIQKIYDSAPAGQTDDVTNASDAMKKAQTDLEAFRPTSVLSSGPYTLALSDVGESQIVMNRTTKTTFGQAAKFAKVVVYKGDTDVTTPLIQSKDLYYSTDYFAPTIEKSFTDKGIKIIRAPRSPGRASCSTSPLRPLNKVEVRQAIAYAINRTQSDKVLLCADRPGREVHGEYLRQQRVEIPDRRSDCQAESLQLRSAKSCRFADRVGFKKGSDGMWVDDKGMPLAFDLSYPSDYTDWVPVAQDAASQLTDFGIKITLRGIPDTDHRVSIRKGDFQMAIRLWGYPNVLPYYAFHYLYDQNSVGGTATMGTGYTDVKTHMGLAADGTKTDFHALVLKMAAGTDQGPQKAAVAQAALDYNANLPTIPLVERFYNCPLVTDNLSGLPADSDPLWGNVGGSDNAINVLLMNGTIGPKSS